MRVHELAKELGISSKEVIAKLSELGVEAKSHMSTVESDAVELLLPGKGDDAPEEATAAPDEEAKPEPAAEPETTPAPAAPQPEAPATPAGDDKTVSIRGAVIVKELAELIGMRPNQVVAELMSMNVFASMNERLEPAVAKKIATKHGYTLEVEKRSAEHKPALKSKIQEEPEEEDKPEDMKHRPPVVTFLGHVDHGKTSLLDRIREASVAKKEAGGITQHIGAYTVDIGEHGITFLDTPGHAAFTAMRARGANLTDIAVIIIAADDGIMPQTQEAIQHAKASEASIMVAINKIDLPGSDPNKVKQQLQAISLAPEDWGGETICCEVSAETGEGIDHLLEMIALQAEVLELRANPSRRGRGYVIEAQLEAGMGPTATLLVKQGTLKVGDAILSGPSWGRIKALINDSGEKVKTAGPSMPVKCLGLSGVPESGSEFRVTAEKTAKALATEMQQQLKAEQLAPTAKVSLDTLYDHLSESGKPELKAVLKADVHGSLEAISHALSGIKTDKITLNLILEGVGNITVNDVLLASASDAVVLGFNVPKENGVNAAAKREGVDIRLHAVIYELVEEIQAAMVGMLDPIVNENVIGHAEIKQVFPISKLGTVAGCMVMKGRIAAKARARVKREDESLYEGTVASLKRFQNDVSEVREGQECGIRLDNFAKFEEGDVIEFYEVIKVAQTL